MVNDNDAPADEAANERAKEQTPPWLQPVDEAVAEPPAQGLAAMFALIPRPLLAALSLGVIALFGGLIWMLYDQQEQGGEVVRLSAPEGPAKIEPQDRGGMQVPHQDKLVFNRVTGERLSTEVTLRAGAETALEKPKIPDIAPLETEAPAEISAEISQASAAKTVEAEVKAEETSQTDQISVSADPAKVASSGLPTDLWAIQIAAFRMKNDAVAWMVKTKYDHAKVFDGLASEIVEAKRDMATYYRVRFGTFPDRSAALAKCDEAKSVGLNCIVVTPR